MKILTLVYSIGPGGTERAAVNYAVAYKQAGCDSRVWVLGEGHDRKKKLESNDIIIYFDTLTNHLINNQKILLWKPDIIHIHTFNKNFFDILYPFKILGSKIVETNVFSRPRLEETSKIIDVSFQLAYWGFWKYRKWMGVKDGYPLSLRLPYLIFNEDFIEDFPEGREHLRKTLNIPDDSFIAGRVGQAHPSKWDKKIFDVVKSVIAIEKKIYFVFVGLPENLRQEHNTLDEKVKSHIRLIDFIVEDRLLAEFYKSIDVFIHISQIGESFGFVLVEAMICGCPVLTLSTPFRDNAQFEVVGHNIGGYCATSIIDFSQALLKIYRGEMKFNHKQLYENVHSRFSNQVLIDHLLLIYTGLCNHEKVTLTKLSNSDFKEAKRVVNAQMKLFGLKGFLAKFLLKIVHTTTAYRLIQMNL